jgi:hypothetical protein
MNTDVAPCSPEGFVYSIQVDVGEYEEIPFQFSYRMDGSGTCKDLEYGDEEIAFAWEPSIVDGLDPERRDEVLQDHATEIFWDEINDQLDEERVLRESDYGSESLSFENGSEEELERVVRLALYSFPSIWDNSREEIDVTVNAASENQAACVDDYCELMEAGGISDAIKDTLRELIDLGLRWNWPVGFHLEYNDGASGRASGYCESPNTVDYTIQKPSFHELAQARQELVQILTERGLENEAKQLLLRGE